MNNPLILIIDDEPAIRRMLQINLESQDYRVILATTAKEGTQMAASFNPDLILLDIGLPDQSGLDLLKDLRVWYNRSVLILSVENQEETIVRALDHGADDFLSKPFRNAELLARIRSSLRRHVSEIPHQVVRSGFVSVDLVARAVYRQEEPVKLTSTEFNLLALLARNQGRVLTHHYLLREVWGAGYQSETQYLRVFVANLRKKLENNPDKPEIILTESGIGYRFM